MGILGHFYPCILLTNVNKKRVIFQPKITRPFAYQAAINMRFKTAQK